MRRLFVIFLILLFPLNVFALSMSVAQLHDAPAAQPLAAAPVDDSRDAAPGVDLAGAFDCETSCDIDPDEPPSGAEFHYIVDLGRTLSVPGRAAIAPVPQDADPDCHAISPPVKPPRAA